MSSFVFFLMVLHISVFVVYCRRFPPFLVVSTSGLVSVNGDEILDFSGLLITLATRSCHALPVFNRGKGNIAMLLSYIRCNILVAFDVKIPMFAP